MKQFFKMFFASLLAMIVASVIIAGIAIGMIVSAIKSAGTQKTTAKSLHESSILVLGTGHRLHEQGEDNSFSAFSNDISYSAGLHDIIVALHKAKTDDNVRAVLLKLEGGVNGWATIEQIREALIDFKSSGKKIYAYGEGISQRDYFLGSAADVLYLNPSGMMELKGLASQLTFFKGTLDKLGVQPEIFYAGKFKSATEPFRAEKMSDANRLQLSEILHDIWASFLEAAAKKTQTDTASIQHLASVGGIYFASDALRSKLVDGMKYWDEMEDQLRPLVSKKPDEKVPYISIDEYAEHIEHEGKGEDRIAILFAEGPIVDGKGEDYQIGSETLVKSIRQIARNKKIKAVVMRVNSPGGSALASEVILRELQLLRAKKPLIVSMGDVAASGGYYISAGADSIFAMSNTITGSIGVFGMMFNIGDALKNKLGVTFDEVKNAPMADFPTMSRSLTPEEGARMQSVIDTIYHTFKSRIAEGRHMDIGMVDSIAQGRVWTGTDAKSIGLVDGIGGLDRALHAAASRAKLSEYRVVSYPEPVDRFKAMLRRLSNSPLSSDAAVKAAITHELQDNFALYQQVQWLKQINGKAQMMMPFTPEIR
jgi:protease-4